MLVSSHVGKTIHRALRQKTHHLYDAYMQRQQLGGKLRMPISIPLHMTRAFLRWKSREAKPTAIVFLDLTEAFYRTLRPLAVGGVLSDHGIGLMCARLGLDSADMHDLHRLLQEPSALAEAQAPAHVQRMLQAFHRDTWFQLGQQQDLVRTEIGSRPGDSFADVVFGLLWAKLLKKLETKLVHHGILESIPDIELPHPFVQGGDMNHPAIPLLGPTWMDDLSMLISASTNSELVSKTQLAISLLLDDCLDFQMEPNLKRGKTEVMFTFKGGQSRDFRREFYSGKAGLTVICERQTFSVSVVSRYVHLGGLIHHKDVNKQEIKRRFAIANQAFQQHKRLIYRNKNLSWDVRCNIFNTLIMSKLLYGLESWTFPTIQSRLLIHNGVMKLYKRLLGAQHDAHLSDLDILVQTNMPDPTELLRRARLRYFGTVHNCRAHAHWGLLQEDTDWVALIRDDLQWLWHQIGTTAGLEDPTQHFLQWRDIIIHHSVYWKKLIRRGVQHACLQRKKEFHAIVLHSKIGRLLQQEGWVNTVPSQDTIAKTHAVTSCFGCMQCQRKFASLAGESVHMCRTHGVQAKERFLFDGTQCPHCLREYHTHSKVLVHLRNSEQCRTALRARRFLCRPVPGIGSTVDRALVEIQDGALPLLQAQGPKLPPPVIQDWESFDIQFLEAIYLHLVESDQEVILFDHVHEFIKTYPISWTQCRLTLLAFCDRLTVEDAEVLRWSYDEVVHCIRQMAHDCQWKFLNDHSAAVVHHQPASLPDWESWCAGLAAERPASWTEFQPSPQSLTRQKVLLHAFAGRRRRGDVEWYLDTLSNQHEGCVILTVSIDIIIDPIHGDITREETRELWLHYIRQGHVAGFLAGPPCNTWSRVRAVRLEGRCGPRVVRTPEAPWGIDEMRFGELQQVTIGTLLLGFALECMVALALHSGSGILEHPKDPEDDKIVSIWRLPVVQMILQLPGFRLVHLSQGLFGAPSPKPTTLMVLRLHSLEKHLHTGMLSAKLAYGETTGRDTKGNFNTAPLKEYPPGFCKAMARSFHHDFCTDCTSMEYGARPDLPTSFSKLCVQMRDHDFGRFIGLD